MNAGRPCCWTIGRSALLLTDLVFRVQQQLGCPARLPDVLLRRFAEPAWGVIACEHDLVGDVLEADVEVLGCH